MSKLLFVGLALVLALQTAYVLVHFNDSVYDPLGAYPEQVVRNEEGPSGFPEVAFDDELEVRGTKCNESDEQVDVFASMRWESVEPPGSVIEVISAAPTTREPGCTAETFYNAIPDEVRERVVELNEDGIAPTWNLVGFEQPVDAKGELGVGRDWNSETFVIRPE